MIPIERHQRILALVEQRGAVSINELTEILGVSHMTIRRDVSKLEEQGLLVSVSGGVRAVSRLAAEPSHLVKSTLQSEEKQAIGALAASHIVISLKTVASIWMPGLPPWRWRGRSSTGTISRWSPMILR
ncbi:transcriptional regulator, DeoR family [Klebsiella pneumoniae UHKPC22]|nr:transcriptional regulator, DeoR family [Klebsiella pneumoniae UHKPC22]